MGILKAITQWESTAAASVAINEKLVALQAKRVRLLFEALKQEGFTDDQAVQIVAGTCGGSE